MCLLPIAWLPQAVLRGAVGVPVLGAGRATRGVVVAPSAATVYAAENDGLTTFGPAARDGRVAAFVGRSVVWRGARRSRWQGGASRPGYRCYGVRGTFGTWRLDAPHALPARRVKAVVRQFWTVRLLGAWRWRLTPPRGERLVTALELLAESTWGEAGAVACHGPGGRRQRADGAAAGAD